MPTHRTRHCQIVNVIYFSEANIAVLNVPMSHFQCLFGAKVRNLWFVLQCERPCSKQNVHLQ